MSAGNPVICAAQDQLGLGHVCLQVSLSLLEQVGSSRGEAEAQKATASQDFACFTLANIPMEKKIYSTHSRRETSQGENSSYLFKCLATPST